MASAVCTAALLLSSIVLLASAAAAGSHATARSGPQPSPLACSKLAGDSLERAIQTAAVLFNTSFAAAATLVAPDGRRTTLHSAHGYDWRAFPGSQITTRSLIPGGSAIKPFTASSCLRLMQRGLLDLDRPVYTYIDPWLRAQNHSAPTLLQLWGNNTRIQTVTTRQLLSMRARHRRRRCSFGCSPDVVRSEPWLVPPQSSALACTPGRAKL